LPPYRMANINQQELPTSELSHGRVLLVYITTSCEPCVKEVKVISRLHALNLPNLRIYGVSFERPAQVATFVKEFDLKFPVLIDMSSQLARALEIRYFPSTYLVEDGVITKQWRGVTLDEAELHRQLNVQ
jgi:peroxiredoxin